MLKPSLNDIVEKIDNRYYLIATVSKRAREQGKSPNRY